MLLDGLFARFKLRRTKPVVAQTKRQPDPLWVAVAQATRQTGPLRAFDPADAPAEDLSALIATLATKAPHEWDE